MPRQRSLNAFVRTHRDTIRSVARAAGTTGRLTDEDLKDWVLNDERLYNEAKRLNVHDPDYGFVGSGPGPRPHPGTKGIQGTHKKPVWLGALVILVVALPVTWIATTLMRKSTASAQSPTSKLRLPWKRTSETPPVFMAAAVKQAGSWEAYNLYVGQFSQGAQAGKWGLTIETVLGQRVGEIKLFDSQAAAQHAGEGFVFKD